LFSEIVIEKKGSNLSKPFSMFFMINFKGSLGEEIAQTFFIATTNNLFTFSQKR
jgi:hypothetical protein